MTIFKQVKDSVDIVDVARLYGVRFISNTKAHCPFHDDKHPSFSCYRDEKGEQKFQCFSGACSAYGDVIDLVSRLENLSPIDAAQVLSHTYHLDIDFKKPVDWDTHRRLKAKHDREEELRNWVQEAYWSLMEYEAMLDDWRKTYFPIHPKVPFSPKFVEASSSKADHLIYLQTIISGICGNLSKMAEFYMVNREFIENLQRRLTEERTYARRVAKHTVPAGSDRILYFPDNKDAVEAL